MTALSPMDRKSRALWQEAAARKRKWYDIPNPARLRRSRAVVFDVRFGHKCLLDLARNGTPWDPFWWA